MVSLTHGIHLQCALICQSGQNMIYSKETEEKTLKVKGWWVGWRG